MPHSYTSCIHTATALLATVSKLQADFCDGTAIVAQQRPKKQVVGFAKATTQNARLND
jgi:hypothetical protein